jgi:predicted TIM-barrel fold metal-dependent hydrolase
MALLQEFDHIYVENSWQVSPGAVALLADAGGADRILFGSMAPLRPMRPALNMVADAELTDAEKADILARNALRFLGRDQQAATVDDKVPKVMGMPQIPAIDVHCHFRVMPEQPSVCLDAADVQKELERFNIELAIVSSTAAYKDDMNIGNQEMLRNVDAFDRMLGSVAVNPDHLEDSVKWLDIAVKDRRIIHVTVNPCTQYERYSSPRWMRLFAQIAVRELPVFYNTGGQDEYRRSASATVQGHLFKVRGASPEEVEMFRHIDQLFPELPIILGHGHGLEGLELARTCRNIYLDLCSTYPEQNVYRRAVDAVGADRVVFGSDLELISPAFVLGSIWEADLSEEEQRQILRGNACRILKLSQQS